MADLDDFFSKRDKKKKSKKEEQFVVDDIAKILDQKAKDRKNQETNKSTYQVPPTDDATPVSEYKAQEFDDEWKEAEDNKPDYTGLKIQELILTDEEDDETKDGGGAANEEEGTVKEGPWMKQQQPVSEAATPEEPISVNTVEQQQPISAEEAVLESGDAENNNKEDGGIGGEPKKKYIPPHMKHLAESQPMGTQSAAAAQSSTPIGPAAPLSSSASGTYVPPSKRGMGGGSGASGSSTAKPRKPAVIPKINDEELFPSLEKAIGLGKS